MVAAASATKTAKPARDPRVFTESARSKITDRSIEVRVVEDVVKIDADVKVVGFSFTATKEAATAAAHHNHSRSSASATHRATAAAAAVSTTAAATRVSSRRTTLGLAEAEILSDSQINREVLRRTTEVPGNDLILVVAGDVAI